MPITIGDNCWIGADVTILSGVTIGSNTVIGAKSVVTKDIPDHVIAVGNPCRVMRAITEKDSVCVFLRCGVVLWKIIFFSNTISPPDLKQHIKS